MCTIASINAFTSCSNIHAATLGFGEFTTDNNVFKVASGVLEDLYIPNCTLIGANAFKDYESLIQVNAPSCLEIHSTAFAGCNSLSEVLFPMCINVGFGAFDGCLGITSIVFSNCQDVGDYAFQNCENLEYVELLNCSNIGYSTFYNCVNLSNLTLPGAAKVSLLYSNAFNNTPIADASYGNGTYGRICVPDNLVDYYKSATNWSYFSDQIVAISDFNLE
mgnify:CR=1 FL=1